MELYKLIIQLDNSHSKTHLGISNFVLKKIALNVVDILTVVFNRCIAEGTFPSALKIAEVIPLFKKGDRKNMDNYRPISMLSVFSKIFEKAIKTRMLGYLNKISFFSDLQFGFRNGRSTEDALLNFCSGIYKGLNNKLKNAALFIDIKKAFDSVNHGILLDKLFTAGFRGNTFKLFSSYLTGRKQNVRINGIHSNLKDICLGVPQGSVLGPVLFLIFFNSLFLQKFKGKLTAFADDVGCSYTANTVFDTVCDINFDLDILRKWFSAHKLLLSEKTKVMFFSLSGSVPLVDNLYYHCASCSNLDSYVCAPGCFKIDTVESFKYLGVTIDVKLNWSEHTLNLKKYFYTVIRQFYHLRNFCSPNLLTMIYYGLFNSKLQYGMVNWGGTHDNLTLPLLTQQKCVVRIILKKNTRVPSFDLFKSLSILPVKHLFYYKVLKEYFRRIHYYRQYRISESYNLRINYRRLALVPPHHVQHFLSSFVVIAPRLFNLLPVDIINVCYGFGLLKKIKSWLFEFNHFEIKNLIRILI